MLVDHQLPPRRHASGGGGGGGEDQRAARRPWHGPVGPWGGGGPQWSRGPRGGGGPQKEAPWPPRPCPCAHDAPQAAAPWPPPPHACPPPPEPLDQDAPPHDFFLGGSPCAQPAPPRPRPQRPRPQPLRPPPRQPSSRKSSLAADLPPTLYDARASLMSETSPTLTQRLGRQCRTRRTVWSTFGASVTPLAAMAAATTSTLAASMASAAAAAAASPATGSASSLSSSASASTSSTPSNGSSSSSSSSTGSARGASSTLSAWAGARPALTRRRGLNLRTSSSFLSSAAGASRPKRPSSSLACSKTVLVGFSEEGAIARGVDVTLMGSVPNFLARRTSSSVTRSSSSLSPLPSVYVSSPVAAASPWSSRNLTRSDSTEQSPSSPSRARPSKQSLARSVVPSAWTTTPSAVSIVLGWSMLVYCMLVALVFVFNTAREDACGCS
mmetsp:Transcript_19893/g.58999  ORF Transcript_19893/g.58999 Transcript_19893/m.58999 type:complete len:440 (+) Transcript_19893:143-1462(+)